MKSIRLAMLMYVGLSMTSLMTCWAASDDAIEKQVQILLDKMTIQEKVGQMTQVTLAVVAGEEKDGWCNLDPNKLREAVVDHQVGSLLNCAGQARSVENWNAIIRQIQEMATQQTRLGIPIIYGIDSIHGANYVRGATLFPQSIAMAATGNRELVYREGQITALETRAAGIPWNFNPVLGLGRDPRWSRFWETFGEDSYLTVEFGKRYIQGQQGDDFSQPHKVAACMKHYLGYSVPHSGKDRTPAYIPERQLRELFLPPFAAAARAGVATVMVNSSEINGIPVHSSPWLLTEVLRQELQFKGFVVSDWQDVKNLYERERVAKDYRAATKLAVLAGMDMCMVPYNYAFYDHLLDLVEADEVPLRRIDQAVADILRVKYRLGLFDAPFADPNLADQFASAAAQAVNLQAAQEAVTLLKNDTRILPLAKDTKVLVTGPCADKLTVLNGGWSLTWQGDREDLLPQDKLTIHQALVKNLGEDQVLHLPGAGFDKTIDVDKVRAVAAQVDVIVACMGEPPYCETPGNIDDLTLSSAQLQLVEQLATVGKPIVLVLVEGRPRVIRSIVDQAGAILMAYLPGMEGGQAIADVLCGDVNPSGKLPFTYPKYAGWHTPYDHKYSEAFTGNRFDPQWTFGFGLSYTVFDYNDLTLSKAELERRDKVTVSVNVTNIGDRAGKEQVQLFVSDLVASITPPVRRLRGFEKISLEPGETKAASFKLSTEDLAFIGRNHKRMIEPGEFEVRIGSQTKRFKVK
ncbi:glycoside hydrolase family 3 N-terminal domain-containing protein [Planctomycetota bacterium]